MLALDFFIKETPARWWDAHKEVMKDRPDCRKLMKLRLGTEVENIVHKYIGESDPTCHVEQCMNLWSSIPEIVLVSRFFFD
jgi:hypothetical protein